MTVDELYKHITAHMTAEEALMKLLTGHLIEYEKLKFSEEGKEIHPVILITMATLDMGWSIAVPSHDDNPDAEIEGMIVGTNKYIDSVLSKEENGREENS
jgi:hypothetical protein